MTTIAPSVAIVGGGLAGLAAAVALSSAGFQVELFESRRSLGGRASSFRDPASDEVIDQCQHVSMRCCTNLADFCRRTGIAELFETDRVVNFIGPDARRYALCAARWLPAPLHLATSLWGLRYLSRRDRVSIARAMWKLMRYRDADDRSQPTVAEWLSRAGQSPAAIDGFWGVILTSALGEEPKRASISAARKVIVDGFLATRDSYVLEIPKVPLAMLYGERLTQWCVDQGIALRLNSPVRKVSRDSGLVVTLADGSQRPADHVIIAVPWLKLADLLSNDLARGLDWLADLEGIDPSPITGVHLWFDRPITTLRHAALVGRLSQWMFNRNQIGAAPQQAGYYYQVVISASRTLAGRDRETIVAQVCDELAAIWPEAARAELLRARVVTDHAAVFSPRAGLERIRPSQATAIRGLYVAGDWTATSWPATMEGAVRSGYLAAQAVARASGLTREFVVRDLPRGWLARRLLAT